MYVAAMLDQVLICFDRAPDMIRPCSRYLLAVLEVSFDCARGMFRYDV